MKLTDSQVRQLRDFCDQRHREDERPDKGILIREVPNLGTGCYEVTILDENGEPTEKRVLFPT